MAEDIASIARYTDEHLRLGQAVTRIISEFANSLDSRPVTSMASVQDLVALFDEPLPVSGSATEEILGTFEQDVLANGMQIASPNYFGLFNPTPIPIAVWADVLTSAINQNGAVWRNSPAANVIEHRVIKWLCELLQYGPTAFGTLTSGGSEANLVALKCARDRVDSRIRDEGASSAGGDMVVYASDQCHYSLVKSVDILGLGRNSIRKIPTDSRFHINMNLLTQEIDRDRANGKLICAIAGAAGATSTGIVDPLDELADVARENACWFHVDAAYGGALAFSAKHRSRLKRIELADSITVDPHKWMFVPFACGAVLVRDGGSVLRRAFDITPEYLTEDRGGADVEFDLFRYGQLGTVRFNALKLWMSIKLLGITGYERIIDRQIELTNYFASRIDELPDFQRLGEVETAVCCFRFLPPSICSASPEEQDALQQKLQQRVEKSGKAWFATTVLHGRRAVRVNINSLLTEKRHVKDLLETIRRESQSLVDEGKMK